MGWEGGGNFDYAGIEHQGSSSVVGVNGIDSDLGDCPQSTFTSYVTVVATTTRSHKNVMKHP